VRAIREGRNIITDVRMVEAGIMKYRLEPFGAKAGCFSSDKPVIEAASALGMTKTAASMRKAAEVMEGAVVAIGNAPTALSDFCAS
jgi:precorrin-8X/cobalt-precorrin-8 methylmutase